MKDITNLPGGNNDILQGYLKEGRYAEALDYCVYNKYLHILHIIAEELSTKPALEQDQSTFLPFLKQVVLNDDVLIRLFFDKEFDKAFDYAYEQGNLQFLNLSLLKLGKHFDRTSKYLVFFSKRFSFDKNLIILFTDKKHQEVFDYAKNMYIKQANNSRMYLIFCFLVLQNFKIEDDLSELKMELKQLNDLTLFGALVKENYKEAFLYCCQKQYFDILHHLKGDFLSYTDACEILLLFQDHTYKKIFEKRLHEYIVSHNEHAYDINSQCIDMIGFMIDKANKYEQAIIEACYEKDKKSLKSLLSKEEVNKNLTLRQLNRCCKVAIDLGDKEIIVELIKKAKFLSKDLHYENGNDSLVYEYTNFIDQAIGIGDIDILETIFEQMKQDFEQSLKNSPINSLEIDVCLESQTVIATVIHNCRYKNIKEVMSYLFDYHYQLLDLVEKYTDRFKDFERANINAENMLKDVFIALIESCDESEEQYKYYISLYLENLLVYGENFSSPSDFVSMLANSFYNTYESNRQVALFIYKFVNMFVRLSNESIKELYNNFDNDNDNDNDNDSNIDRETVIKELKDNFKIFINDLNSSKYENSEEILNIIGERKDSLTLLSNIYYGLLKGGSFLIRRDDDGKENEHDRQISDYQQKQYSTEENFSISDSDNLIENTSNKRKISNTSTSNKIAKLDTIEVQTLPLDTIDIILSYLPGFDENKLSKVSLDCSEYIFNFKTDKEQVISAVHKKLYPE